ncbi:E3 ubiquitin-protein ligase RNF13 [Fistulifera solaris]|uniref:E3 ubiquitin-protein ligase RNF13 n=1 Tax=Fistulifera solaris TaxID=1519565 RepID=A0A1Z5KFR0_FISSO|nr:E3 ubiquitin-protein ligase RNF13 [Fistulifera solaris]|eukprot:GAX25154.1 E3 ubiquitin-protein ligase RNF13 [Fistulifera solaris]
MKSFIWLAILPGVVRGEITDMQTGRRFRSQPEEDLPCKQFWRGYEYMGRLQYIEENPYLCPTADQEYNIITPSDGLPVALLVQGGGGCSLQEKVDMALKHVSPNHVVRYLIVGNGRHNALEADHEEIEEEMEDEELVLSDLAAALLPNSLKNALFSGDTWISRRRDPREGDIPLYIVRVSQRTVSEMVYEMIQKQSSEMRKMGGPRISLDSRTNSMDGDTGALLLSLISLLSACLCSFMLILNSNRWAEAEDQAHHAAQQRPTRRRLTREQVRELLPKYLYDAEAHSLELIVEEGQILESEIPLLPDQQEMDCCAICLDDYETGNKLRCLPCKHAFHANCIGKWLSERSATCPLCKIELLPEEEENEESVETSHPVRTSTETSNEGLWGRLFHVPGRTDAIEQVGVADTPFALMDNETTAETRRQPSWWRRIISSRSSPPPLVEESVAEMLTEPLLSEDERRVATPEATIDSTQGDCPDVASRMPDSHEGIIHETV